MRTDFKCYICGKEKKFELCEIPEGMMYTFEYDICTDCFIKLISEGETLRHVTLANFREDEIEAVIFTSIQRVIEAMNDREPWERIYASPYDITKVLTAICMLKLRQMLSLKLLAVDREFLRCYNKSSKVDFYDRINEASFKNLPMEHSYEKDLKAKYKPHKG